MTPSPVGAGTDEAVDELTLEAMLEDERLELATLLDATLLELLLATLLALLELELEVLVPLGAEHSLVPPETLVPAPKVTSPQTKLPVRVLKVNLSARP